jgi:hypothetical protein
LKIILTATLSKKKKTINTSQAPRIKPHMYSPIKIEKKKKIEQTPSPTPLPKKKLNYKFRRVMSC